jgi:hypothetical protein
MPYTPTDHIVYVHQLLINAIQAGRADDCYLLARVLGHLMPVEYRTVEYQFHGRY